MKLLNRLLMPGTRWLKLARDLMAEKGRLMLMLTAITVSIIAIGTVLGAYAVLTREIATNYLETNPASATLELEGNVSASVVALARQHPSIQDAEARDAVLARAKIGEDWRPLLLFVIDDFSALRINTFPASKGQSIPATGEMLIERSAAPVLETDVGGHVLTKTAHGLVREIPVAGLVHDPGLAPANQERTGYGYISRATLSTLGEQPVLHELRIILRDPQATIQDIETVAADLAQRLTQQGIVVHEIRVPPPRQHPHQRQMVTILFMMLAFSVMAFVLSGILVSSSLAAMLARQVREIGIMKTIGARTAQIFGLYALMVVGIGLTAVALAIPLGWLGSQVLAKAVALQLNINLIDRSVPYWVFAAQALAGGMVPLLLASIPIGRASRLSVREAIDQYGVTRDALRWRTAKLPWSVRNALRRPVRLALTVALLAAGGAMFMTALNVSAGWQRNVAKVYETRHYDVEVRFHEAQPLSVAERIRALPGIKSVEAWGYSPAAFAKPGQINIVRTYPDRGHASFSVMGLPSNSTLIDFPVLAGRWLLPTDTDSVVLNHAAVVQVPHLKIGDRVALSLDGKAASQTLVGIVEEIGSPAIAYVTDQAFEQIAGTQGHARILRIATLATTPPARIAAIRAIEQRLVDDGISVETAVPLAELRTAMADHIVILTRTLLAMAVVMATVGALGLTSAMGVSIVERTREFAVMKTVGGTPRRIMALLISEALFIGALSWIVALILAAPLTALVDTLVGRLGFVAPLPFILSPAAALGWLALLGVVSLGSTILPARRAAELSVAKALVSL